MTHDNEQLRPGHLDPQPPATSKDVTPPAPLIRASLEDSGTSAEERSDPAESVNAEDPETASALASADGSGPLPLSEEEIAAMVANVDEKALPKAGQSPYDPIPFVQPSPGSVSEERGRGYYGRLDSESRYPSSYGYWQSERDAKLLTPHKARPRYHRYVVKKEKTEGDTLGFPSFLGSRDWDDDFATIPKPEGLEDFRIVIEPIAWLKMSRIVAACEVEITWNAFVRVDVVAETIRLVVYDIFVPKQIGRPSTFDVSPTGKAESLYAELRSGKFTEAEIDQEMANLRFHGHSHVWMGTSPSGVDNTYIRGVLEKSTPLFYIRAIANKAGRLELTLYLLEYSLKISDFPWSIGWDQFADIDAWATQEVKSKVTRQEYQLPPRGQWGWLQPPTAPKAKEEPKLPELPVVSEKSDAITGESTAIAPETEATVAVEVGQDNDPSTATESVTNGEDPQEPVAAPEPAIVPNPPTLWARIRAWWDAPVKL